MVFTGDCIVLLSYSIAQLWCYVSDLYYLRFFENERTLGWVLFVAWHLESDAQ